MPLNDAFIKLDGIEGESKDSKHENWIEVISFSHDMRQAPSATVSSLGGGTTGRVDMADFSFTKGFDKASPKLYEACCKGIHVPNVSVEFCRASGGDKLTYMKIDMTDVVVSQVSPSAGHADNDFPTEMVSLNFGKIVWTYTQQSRQGGGAAGQVSTNWSSQKSASA
jgi:type VI secretion system secreted protein Hcp